MTAKPTSFRPFDSRRRRPKDASAPAFYWQLLPLAEIKAMEKKAQLEATFD